VSHQAFDLSLILRTERNAHSYEIFSAVNCPSDLPRHWTCSKDLADCIRVRIRFPTYLIMHFTIVRRRRYMRSDASRSLFHRGGRQSWYPHNPWLRKYAVRFGNCYQPLDTHVCLHSILPCASRETSGIALSTQCYSKGINTTFPLPYTQRLEHPAGMDASTFLPSRSEPSCCRIE
jgi:hypothetical protein